MCMYTNMVLGGIVCIYVYMYIYIYIYTHIDICMVLQMLFNCWQRLFCKHNTVNITYIYIRILCGLQMQMKCQQKGIEAKSPGPPSPVLDWSANPNEMPTKRDWGKILEPPSPVIFLFQLFLYMVEHNPAAQTTKQGVHLYKQQNNKTGCAFDAV